MKDTNDYIKERYKLYLKQCQIFSGNPTEIVRAKCAFEIRLTCLSEMELIDEMRLQRLLVVAENVCNKYI